MSTFAVKYRPTSIEDGFIGQDVVAEIIKKSIYARNFSNIMLFAGNSGCGKTTLARIVANLINNGVGDPTEIDAASNNGVDQVRAIIDSATQRSLVGEYKVFIIDECHMITTAGWNAFLKCLEECPKYTIFIFCTTDPQKIPQTVLNRMQRFNFAPIQPQAIYQKLLYICQNEGLTNYERGCDYIARTSRGCLREAITNLERCASYSRDITPDTVKKVLGSSSYEVMFKLTWAIQDKNEADVISILDKLYSEGQDLKQFISLYLDFIVDLTKFKMFNSIKVTDIPEYLASEDNGVVQFTVSKPNSLDTLNKLTETLFKIKSEIKYDNSIKNTILIMLLMEMRGN